MLKQRGEGGKERTFVHDIIQEASSQISEQKISSDAVLSSAWQRQHPRSAAPCQSRERRAQIFPPAKRDAARPCNDQDGCVECLQTRPMACDERAHQLIKSSRPRFRSAMNFSSKRPFNRILTSQYKHEARARTSKARRWELWQGDRWELVLNKLMQQEKLAIPPLYLKLTGLVMRKGRLSPISHEKKGERMGEQRGLLQRRTSVRTRYVVCFCRMPDPTVS